MILCQKKYNSAPAPINSVSNSVPAIMAPRINTSAPINSTNTSVSAILAPSDNTSVPINSSAASESDIHYTFRIFSRNNNVWLWYAPGLNNPVGMIRNIYTGIFEYPVYLKANTAYHYMFSFGRSWFCDPK